MRTNLPLLGAAWLLIANIACGDNSTFPGNPGHDADDANPLAPRVTSNFPANAATDVPLNGNISATFDVAMDRSTLTGGTFTLATEVGEVALPGTVSSTTRTIGFAPDAPLAPNTSFIATITTDAESVGSVALSAAHSWTFRTGTRTIVPIDPVELGMAGTFVLLGKSGITNVPTSMITGDIGVSPITSTAITGLPLTPDATTRFSTTPQVIGRVFAPDFAAPTPDDLTTAVTNMETAFTVAAGRAPDVTELGAGMIGTITLAPGVYKWSSALLIPTSVTLSGGSTDVWIFQIAQDLTLGHGTEILLAGGALSDNVFWQIGGQLVVNTGAHLEGNVLSQTAATLDTGASLNGRLLAQTLVTVRGATIVKPQ